MYIHKIEVDTYFNYFCPVYMYDRSLGDNGEGKSGFKSFIVPKL